MKRSAYLFLFGIMVSYLASSCQHEPIIDDNTGGNGGTNPTDTTDTIIIITEIGCDPDTVYFQNDILPIIQSNCAYSGCHGDGSAQDGVDLTNYFSIISTADVEAFDLDGSDLYEVITETDPDKVMPPPPNNTLNADQITLIATWIMQGALNNSCEECDTTSVTYANVVSPIIQNNCQGCHSGSFPSGGISLTNHAEIQAYALSGALEGVINHDPGYVAMPYNQPQLPDCQLDQIRIWVAEGALDN